MSDYNECKRRGSIQAGDDFASVAEVFNLFGATEFDKGSSSIFSVPGKKDVVCWLVTERMPNGWHVDFCSPSDELDSCGWKLPTRIETGNYDIGWKYEPGIGWRGGMTDEVKEVFRRMSSGTRLVFRKLSRDGVTWYKFIGVFKYDSNDLWPSPGIFDYSLVSKSAECPKAEARFRELGMDEFQALTGQLLVCDLFDDVCVKGADGREGTYKMWPGSTLMVEGVEQAPARLRCRACGSDRVYLIPKRDVELGYFRPTGPGNLESAKLVGAPKGARGIVSATSTTKDRLVAQMKSGMEHIREVLSHEGTEEHVRLVHEILQRISDAYDEGSVVEMEREKFGKMGVSDFADCWLKAHAIDGTVVGAGHGYSAIATRNANLFEWIN